jgi:hypothetical protein
MKKNIFYKTIKSSVTLVLLVLPLMVLGQSSKAPKLKTGAFWEHVQFGGGLAFNANHDYTDITVAPSAIYNFNSIFALGTSLQYSHLAQRNYYNSNLFGGSLIGLVNPIEEIQLSVELEEVHVNSTYTSNYGNLTKSFWNTGLYFGAGYHEDNLTIGARINVLYDKNKDVYGSAFMPFVRVYF